MRAIAPNEVKELIHACRPTALRDKALIDLMYHSGLRVSEAVGLRRSDVDGNRITVRCGKGGKRRVSALTTTYGWFELWLAQSGVSGEDYIFTTRTGQPLATSHVRRLLTKLSPTEFPSHFLPNYRCREFGGLKGVFAELSRILEKPFAATSI